MRISVKRTISKWRITFTTPYRNEADVIFLHIKQIQRDAVSINIALDICTHICDLIFLRSLRLSPLIAKKRCHDFLLFSALFALESRQTMYNLIIEFGRCCVDERVRKNLTLNGLAHIPMTYIISLSFVAEVFCIVLAALRQIGASVDLIFICSFSSRLLPYEMTTVGIIVQCDTHTRNIAKTLNSNTTNNNSHDHQIQAALKTRIWSSISQCNCL